MIDIQNTDMWYNKFRFACIRNCKCQCNYARKGDEEEPADTVKGRRVSVEFPTVYNSSGRHQKVTYSHIEKYIKSAFRRLKVFLLNLNPNIDHTDMKEKAGVISEGYKVFYNAEYGPHIWGLIGSRFPPAPPLPSLLFPLSDRCQTCCDRLSPRDVTTRGNTGIKRESILSPQV